MASHTLRSFFNSKSRVEKLFIHEVFSHGCAQLRVLFNKVIFASPEKWWPQGDLAFVELCGPKYKRYKNMDILFKDATSSFVLSKVNFVNFGFFKTLLR